MNIKKICIIGSGMGGGILANEISKYTNTEVYLMDINELDKKPKENTKSIYNNEFLKIKEICDHTASVEVQNFGMGY